MGWLACLPGDEDALAREHLLGFGWSIDRLIGLVLGFCLCTTSSAMAVSSLLLAYAAAAASWLGLDRQQHPAAPQAIEIETAAVPVLLGGWMERWCRSSVNQLCMVCVSSQPKASSRCPR